MILNSAGLGVSTDGGQTFKSAVTADGVVAERIVGNLISGVAFKTASTNGFGMELHNGEIKFSKDDFEFGTLTATADGATGEPNGFAIWNQPGSIFSINQGGSTGGSLPVFQLPATATAENRQYNLYGSLMSPLVSKQPGGMWIYHDSKFNVSADGGHNAQFQVTVGKTSVWGDFYVYSGSKNAAQVTRDGIRATPAYELAENYVGDIGESKTGDDKTVRVDIDPLVFDLINTDDPYQVFLTAYSDAHFWVSERGKDYFIVSSDTPDSSFGWELKGKRRGFEDQRLVDTKDTYNDLEKMEGLIPNGNQNVQSDS